MFAETSNIKIASVFSHQMPVFFNSFSLNCLPSIVLAVCHDLQSGFGPQFNYKISPFSSWMPTDPMSDAINEVAHMP
jgi:hypothetical protein